MWWKSTEINVSLNDLSMTSPRPNKAANLVRVEFPGGVGSRKAPHKLEGHRAEVEGVPYTHVSRSKATDEILPHVLDVDSGAHLVELNTSYWHNTCFPNYIPPPSGSGSRPVWAGVCLRSCWSSCVFRNQVCEGDRGRRHRNRFCLQYNAALPM